MNLQNIKQAFEQDFFVKNIYNKGGDEIRVDMQRRHHRADEEDFYSFWINRAYFARTYPEIYEKFR